MTDTGTAKIIIWNRNMTAKKMWLDSAKSEGIFLV
eukprot:CAMPEP_0194390858 /NCGR_PEP_ID=MMETSP0174-20130528/112334_1 /TAXON_ID=216777 /ORGANISM="Proboscia alata, Strain PI-D3" /LENGTH=34 /DNA_ID= /DNA_START= /DNA_END= /DNA_ORIENTATION=